MPVVFYGIIIYMDSLSLCIYLSIHPSIHLFIYLSLSLSVYLCTYVRMYMCLCVGVLGWGIN